MNKVREQEISKPEKDFQMPRPPLHRQTGQVIHVELVQINALELPLRCFVLRV